MEKDDKDKKDKAIDLEVQNGRPDEELNFIQEFIERKKLQNRILKEIIDNIKQSDKE